MSPLIRFITGEFATAESTSMRRSSANLPGCGCDISPSYRPLIGGAAAAADAVVLRTCSIADMGAPPYGRAHPRRMTNGVALHKYRVHIFLILATGRWPVTTAPKVPGDARRGPSGARTAARSARRAPGDAMTDFAERGVFVGRERVSGPS